MLKTQGPLNLILQRYLAFPGYDAFLYILYYWLDDGLLQYMFDLFYTGKRQTVVSTFAGANGRRDPEIPL